MRQSTSSESRGDRPPPAQGDPRRQATSALRGFDYQLWQSVHLWTTLGPDEVLYLEAAEDVDRAAHGTVEVGQVKALARPLTLRSRAVRDALRHYWDLQGANRDLRVAFALITTAGRAVEVGAPFGSTAGLDEWDRCRSDLADPSALREFLATLDVGAPLQAFLETATDESLRSHLLRPLRWVTEQPDRHGLRDRVERLVILHGDGLGLAPSQSRPAVDALYARVWEVVTSDPPRCLDRIGFLDTFEAATAVLTPRSVLAPPSATGALTSRIGRVLNADVTPLVHGPVSRAALVRDVRQRLARVPILALTGSSGMGKSTLAALVASAGGEWVRLDLRGREEVEAAGLLDLAAVAIDSLAPSASVVVDDLPRSPTGRLERSLVTLVRAATTRGGRVLATTHDPLSASVLAALGLVDENAHIEIPPLTTDELRGLCLAHECPEGQADRWGRVVELQTSGHPQLAAAHARSAANRGWGGVSDDDLFGSPPPLEQVKLEARRRLVAWLPDLGAADLAYRLSLYLAPFTRPQALRFAAADPPIPSAGHALDVLTGPWLERVDNEHFRVSPLLAKSYEHQIHPDDLIRLHAAAARSFLEPVLHPRALSGLLLHGLRGECGEALIAAFTSMQKVEDTVFDRLAGWISWLAYAATEGDRPLYPPDPTISLFLRQLQIRVAVAVAEEDIVIRALRAAIREAEVAGDVGAPFTSEALRFMFAAQTLTHVEAPEHVAFVIEQAAAAARIAKSGALSQIESMAVAHNLPQPEFDPDLGVTSVADLVGPLISILAVRIRSSEALGMLLDAAEKNSDLADALEPLFQNDVPSSIAMTDGAWLELYRAEKTGEIGDFSEAVEVLRRAIRLADDARHEALAVAARRSLATVLFEHVKNREAALEILDGSPTARVELDEYRAKMLLMEGEAEAALDLYRQVLPSWKLGPGRANTARAYAYQDAVRAAGKAERLDEAVELAEEAIAVAEEELRRVNSPLPLGFRADRAYALYQSGRYSEAIPAFADVLKRLDTAPSDRGFGVLRGRVGHTLVLIESELVRRSPPEGYGEPFVGLFSKPEPDYNDYEAPARPVLIWGRLAHIETLVSDDRTVSDHFLALSDGNGDPLVIHDRAQHQAALAILDAHPELLDRMSESYRLAALGAGVASDDLKPFDLGLAQSALGLVSIRASADRRLASLPVEAWMDRAVALLRADATTTQALQNWRETAQYAADLERGNRQAGPPLLQRMIAGSNDVAVRATAAAALAAHSFDPGTKFYARATILQVAEPRVFSEYLASPVALLCTGNSSDGYAEAAQSLLASSYRETISESALPYFQRVAAGE